jgi:hypothetical protein
MNRKLLLVLLLTAGMVTQVLADNRLRLRLVRADNTEAIPDVALNDVVSLLTNNIPMKSFRQVDDQSVLLPKGGSTMFAANFTNSTTS